MAYYGVAKPAVFMFLLVTVGLSGAAIAAGIAERENRVYDVSAAQRAIIEMAKDADHKLDDQERTVCRLIRGVTYDLWRVHNLTEYNCDRIEYGVDRGSDDNCSEWRRRY